MNRRYFLKTLGVGTVLVQLPGMFIKDGQAGLVNMPELNIEKWTVWDNNFYKICKYSSDWKLEWISIDGRFQYFSSTGKSPGVLFENGIATDLGF